MKVNAQDHAREGWRMTMKSGLGSPQEVTTANVDTMMDLSDVDYDFKRVKFGDIVAGTVVRVSPRDILIDIGSKSEAFVDHVELEKMSADALGKINVGDRILAFVLRPPNRHGNVMLSLAKAQTERDWEEAEQLLKSEQAFEAQIAGFNKGGLIVRVGKVRGFVPATQLESLPARKESAENTDDNSDLAALVGKKLKLKIIELDRPRNRLILSERAALRDLRKTQRDKLLTELKEGDVLTGNVTSVTNFGVFVSLGGVDGLIHLSELAWGKIDNPSALVKVGDTVDVKVLGVDRERQRIALSLKRMQPEPWMTVEDRFKVGQLVTGTITKIAQFGAFARLDDKIEGLIHISELADRRVNTPRDVVKEGDTVTLRVIRVDAVRRRLGLSLKQAADENYTGVNEMPDDAWQQTESTK
ncbi:MAG: S1 RNA-binding domain-containing protein [Chloroflexi bacterium]|nr:S1 RNA-binding domain-containing protein [Chloroflexota bacterium]